MKLVQNTIRDFPYVILLLAVSLSWGSSAVFADEDTAELRAEQKAAKLNAAYLQRLKRLPGPGAALDKVYAFYLDRGTLGTLLQELRESSVATDGDGSDALLIGLIEQRRGRFAEAKSAFETAVRLRPQDAMAVRQLGQVLISLGDNKAAAEALETALPLTTVRRDKSDVYQLLGRIYQRTQQSDKALDLWTRFENAFPNDALVQENIATILVEERQWQAALDRYQILQKVTRDPYKRIQFGTAAAELLLKLDRRDAGIDQFRKILTQLKPGSWQADGIRGRIEQVFLKANDQAALIAYLQDWISQHPDDLDAVARLASSLSEAGDLAGAREWLQRAIDKAPSDVKLRQSLIAELAAGKLFAEAAKQYQQLTKIDSGNTQHLEQWGRLLLRNTAVPESERQAAAAEVWARLLQQRDDDAVHVSHVAGLFRSAGMADRAIALYETAIGLAPTESQYVEYLGEYLHQLNRKNEAVRTLGLMAAGELRTTGNLSRLSQVLADLGYVKEALAAMEAAVQLSPEFSDRIRFAKLLRDSGRYDDCFQQLDAAEAVAVTDEERRLMQQERIVSYQIAGVLLQQIVDRQRQLTALELSETTAAQWQFLGMLQQTAGQLRQAAKSLQLAVKLAPESTTAWAQAADVMQQAGLLADAAEAHRQLAAMDRRKQVEHLKRVAELEHQLGRNEAALKTAQAVMTAAPGNPAAIRFYADMCFRLGQPEQALDALRLAVRANPGDREALQALAIVLADEFRTDEAIELYWRAFQKTEDLNVRVGLIRNLSSLYLRTEQFDQLVIRLKSLAATSDDRRDLLTCLSNAYQAAGDIPSALATIEELLESHARDRTLLEEAVGLAEQSKDLQTAIRYQRRLMLTAPSSEHTSRLASLLLATGNVQSAAELWSNLPVSAAANDGGAQQLLAAIDRLLQEELYDTASDVARQLLVRNSRDWQAMLRLAVAEWRLERRDDALEYCQRIVALSESAEDRSAGWRPSQSTEMPLVAARFGDQLLRDLGPHELDLPGGKGTVKFGPLPIPWPLADYAQARIAALRLQHEYHRLQGDVESFVAQSIARAGLSELAAWDCYYAAPSARTAAVLQPIDSAAAQLVYLYHVRPEDESHGIDAGKLIHAYDTVNAQRPEWLGQIQGVVRVLDALTAVGETVAAERIRLSLRRDNASPSELAAAWELAVSQKNVAEVLQVAERVTASDTLKTLGWTFAELASARIAQDDWLAVEQLLTKFLTVKSAEEVKLAGQRRASSAGTSLFDTFSHRTFSNGRHTNSIRVLTMVPDVRWSLADINFFVNIERLAGEQHWPRLLSTLQAFRNGATADQSLMAELALAHLWVLHGDQNAAAVHVVRAAAVAPDDADLRLRLVRFYQASGNEAEALALLDTIRAVDQAVMQQKETLALQLATSTGNPVRARQAAERLFGLRLGTDTSIQLAARMRTLELDDMADAVLSRIRRSSGNGIETLESLMSQYNQQGNADVAGQIAQQILQETNTGTRRSAAAESIRTAAVTTLAELGQLDSLIARTEQQLQQAPESVELLQSLGEFYRAAGRTEQAMQIAARLTEVQPNSVAHLLKLATQYENVRNFSAACTHYLEVLKRDPQRFTQNYYQYLRTFQNARRLPELADVLLTVDLRKLNNNFYVVGETIESLFTAAASNRQSRADDPNQQKGLQLLAEGWKVFPNERSYLLNQVRDPDVWRLPVMFDYAREGIIPASVQQAVARPWRGIAESPSFDANGKVTGTLTRVLRAMPDTLRQRQFTDEIAAAVSRFPDWHGGRLILSVLQAKSGDQQTAAATLSLLMNDAEVPSVPIQAAWLVGAELQQYGGELLPLATNMLQRAIQQEGFAVSNGYESSAGRRLAMLYGVQRQRKLANTVIQQTIAAADRITYVEPGRKAWQQLNDLSAAGSDAAKLGLPLDAVGLLQKMTQPLLVASEQFRNDGAAHRRCQQARQLQASLSRQISGEVLLEYLSRQPSAADGEHSAPNIDLLLTTPRNNEAVGIQNSIVLSSLRTAANSAQASAIAAVLAKRLASAVGDSNVAVAAFVFAEAADLSALREAAMRALVEMAGRPAVADDVVAWFAAKSLLQIQSSEAAGSALADFAELGAAAGQRTTWRLAMLKERGELAIERGDLELAEQAWSRMLDIIAPETVVSSDSNSKADGTAASAVREVRQRLLNIQPPVSE